MMRTIAAGLLITFLSGMVVNALAMWKDQGVLETRVKKLETDKKLNDNRVNKIFDKIDQIHWHLIKKGK
jgi:hypothetical protein